MSRLSCLTLTSATTGRMMTWSVARNRFNMNMNLTYRVTCWIAVDSAVLCVCRIWTARLLWSLWSRDLGRKEWASLDLSVFTCRLFSGWVSSTGVLICIVPLLASGFFFFFLHVFSVRPWHRWLGFRYRNVGDSVDVLEICSVWDPQTRFMSLLCSISRVKLMNQ